ncbi:MAG: DNA polymerase III subunit delta [Candidatus Hydrogenedentes bacterium]|nr:DNA polymerase III subunit delta [Candidatus Hydrogenedentota bacterium]
MVAKIQDFIDNIGKHPLPPIILFTSDPKPPWGKDAFEPYLVDEAVDKLVKANIDPGMHDLALTTIYADETDPGQVAEEARTLPFLVEKRVVVVRNASTYMAMNTEKRSPVLPLLACLEDPSDSAILILIASKADKRKRLYKACQKNGVVVECPQLSNPQMAEKIRQKIRKQNLSIKPSAVTALIERVGSKLSDMENAITLLTSFVSGKDTITEKDVQDACADVAESTIWALTDAIAQSNVTASLEALHELIAMNKSPDEIMGTINWLLENAYRVHPETQATVAKPFVAKKVAPLAEKFSLQRLKAALALCTRTHFSLRTTGANHHLQIEILVIKLAKGKSQRSYQKR